MNQVPSTSDKPRRGLGRVAAAAALVLISAAAALAQAPKGPAPAVAPTPAKPAPATKGGSPAGTPAAQPAGPRAGDKASAAPMVKIDAARVEARAAKGAAETRRVAADSGLASAWRAAAAEAEATLIADYRTGLAGRLSLRVERSVSVEVERLSEVRVALARVIATAEPKGKATTAGGGGGGLAPARVVLDLKRGRLRVTPPAGGAVNVVTPEGLTVIREEAVISHDAEHGTRVMPVAKPREEPRTK